MNYDTIFWIVVAIATIIYLIKNQAQKQASNQAPAESTDKAPASEDNAKVNGKYQPKTKDELRELCRDGSINLGNIDTSLITDMSKLFEDSHREDFSGIESWDTSNVTNMRGMFCSAESFNQNLDKWDISNVEDMTGMFNRAKEFNRPLYSWNERKLKSAF